MNYLVSAEANVDAVKPGGTVILTLHYSAEADAPLAVTWSPAFRVTLDPATVTLARAEDETGLVTIAATIAPLAGETTCIFILSALDDRRWISVEVAP